MQSVRSVSTEEKNSFCTAIRENAAWLQPILKELFQLPIMRESKTRCFIDDIERIISTNEIQDQYASEPAKYIYLTWIKMLDPKIDQATKEKLCSELAKRFIDDRGEYSESKTAIGGKLSYMPSIIAAPILLFSPIKVLSAYYDYQKRHGEYSDLKDEYFETTLKFLIDTKLFAKQDKTRFLKNLREMFKHDKWLNKDNLEYNLHEAMVTWEKKSLIAGMSANFDAELKSEYDKFKEKIRNKIDNPGTDLRLYSKFDALVFEGLLIKEKCNAETLTNIVKRFNDDKDIPTLAKIYRDHGLNVVEMFKRHLIQLAKATNEPGHYEFSSLFFSKCLVYLKDEASYIAPKIAEFLSAKYYAENSWAFNTIRKELFIFWMDNKPEQIITIVQEILKKPNSTHETPIEKFFWDLSYSEMSENFYNKLATLLIDKLTPEQFIRVYTVVSEKTQSKLVSAILFDKTKAIANLKKINEAYKTGDFSVVFARKIASQIKTINPTLYAQIEKERIFVEEAKNDINADLSLFAKILANESLTHDERRSEIRRLENLHDALGDKKIDTCPVVIKMFDSVLQKNWPDLFAYFDAEIIYWSFPEEERFLKEFYPDEKSRPLPRKNTWLSYKDKWEEVLYGTLVAILADYSKKDLRRSVAHWALGYIDKAFNKSSQHFSGLVDNVLKKFFLNNLPKSITIFKAFHENFRDKYHPLEYFSRDDIYKQVAAWLPEDPVSRAKILVQLLQVDGGFELALRSPFVRNKEELAVTAFVLLNTRTEHIVNLFEKLPINVTKTLFKTLNQFDSKGFVTLIMQGFSDLGKANLPMPNYVNMASMLFGFCKKANMDIFQIIDADPNKEDFVKAFTDFQTWEKIPNYSRSYDLIFSVIHHYLPEQLPKKVFEYVQHYMKKDNDLWKLSTCIKAAKEASGNKLVLPKLEESTLVEFLVKELHKKDNDFRYTRPEIELFADFIPNLDKVLLELMTKGIKEHDDLDLYNKDTLDNLVRIYGFSHINTLCLDFKSEVCSNYLVNKFAKFPDVLQQMDEAVKLYDKIFDEYEYKISSVISIWSFNDNLRSAILKAAEKSKEPTFEINVAELSIQWGIAPDLAALMPPIKIKSTITAAPQEVSKSDPTDLLSKSAASLLKASWEKSGLTTSGASSTSIPSEKESVKRGQLSI